MPCLCKRMFTFGEGVSGRGITVRFLANENFPAVAVDMLRSAGHDVAWVRTDAPGSTDRQVLARAISEDRVLLTFDKDFGELAFHQGISASSGIILFRIPLTSPTAIASTIVMTISSRTDWNGHYSVVEQTRVRMITLPNDDQQL